MKSMRKYEDGINHKSGLYIMNMGGGPKFPVFESLEEQKYFDDSSKYKDLSKEDAIQARATAVENAPLTDKYFAVIGTSWANIHDDYDYWHVAFTNLDDAKKFVEENKNALSNLRIYNEMAEKIEFEIEDEDEAEMQ